MNYEIFESTDYSGIKTSMVNIFNEDGSVECFPVDETNPRYIQFLAELEEQA